MKKSNIRAFIILILLGGVAGLSFFLLARPRYGEVQGFVKDGLSGDAVRKVTIRVGDRSTIRFTSTSFSLTEIPPGSYILTAKAPGYEDFSLPIQVQRGPNRVDIVMKGREIPDLHGVIVFAEPQEKGLQIDVRFTDSQNVGIMNYPALPLTMEGTLFIRKGGEGKYLKGKEVYRGPIPLLWDSKGRLEKNKGFIPWEKMELNRQKETQGILEVILHTPQGDFKETTTEVEFWPKAK